MQGQLRCHVAAERTCDPLQARHKPLFGSAAEVPVSGIDLPDIWTSGIETTASRRSDLDGRLQTSTVRAIDSSTMNATDRTVVVAPLLDDDRPFFQTVEDFAAQALVARLSVE